MSEIEALQKIVAYIDRLYGDPLLEVDANFHLGEIQQMATAGLERATAMTRQHGIDPVRLTWAAETPEDVKARPDYALSFGKHKLDVITLEGVPGAALVSAQQANEILKHKRMIDKYVHQFFGDPINPIEANGKSSHIHR